MHTIKHLRFSLPGDVNKIHTLFVISISPTINPSTMTPVEDADITE